MEVEARRERNVQTEAATMQNVFVFNFQTQPGDLIQIQFRGAWARVLLLNEIDYQRLYAGHQIEGTYYETSPVFLRAPSGGNWYVIVDFEHHLGSPTEGMVIPWEFTRIIAASRGRVVPVIPPSDPSRTYYTGEAIQRTDEIEIWYPDLHGIPHRGIVHSLQNGPFGVTVNVIHNSKRGGVCIVSFADFEQGKLINLRRRADSPEHADAIIARADSAIRHPYHWRMANCEQFTDWCYTGEPGKSETLSAGGLLAAGAVGLALLLGSDRR
jgi:hypothetical protein